MKKTFTNPSVKKVEFTLTDRIAASGCNWPDHGEGYPDDWVSPDSCMN